MKKTLAVSIYLFSIVFGISQTTVSTPVVGFSKVSLPSGTVLVAPGFVKSAVYSGSSTVSGQIFSAAGLTAGNLNQSSFGDRPNYPVYYVEIVSGSNEGLCFDIVSNTTTSVTAVGVPASLNGQLVSVVIRPHLTLDDLVSSQSGLADYSDAVNIVTSDGSTLTRYYANGSWLAEDFSTPAGHTTIYPGNAVSISTGGSVVINTSGVVKATKTQVPLYASAVNLVGPMNPSGSTKINSLGIQAALAPYADGFNTYTVDGAGTTTGTYYSDGTSILDAGFSPLDSNSTDSVPSNVGFAVSVSADTYWTMPSVLTP